MPDLKKDEAAIKVKFFSLTCLDSPEDSLLLPSLKGKTVVNISSGQSETNIFVL